MRKIITPLLLLLIFVSCTGGNHIVDKRITLQINGLKVRDAVLLKEDGTMLPLNGTLGIGEKVFCRLTIDGWKTIDGKVSLGTSEKVSTATGNVLLDEPDLFAKSGAINEADAHILTLRAVITSLQKSIHEFKVEFRIWDKQGNGEITGSFPFRLN